MVAWPEKASNALAYLFRRYNDIDVYIEDVRGKNVYEILINRMLGDRAKVRSVFSLGGRNQVLHQCSIDQGTGGRKRIYIIDSDLDLIFRNTKPKLKRLYRLNVYCLENLLVSKNSAVEIIYESVGDITKNDIEEALNFESWRDEVTKILIPLFIIYAIAHERKIREKNVDYNAMALCEGRIPHRKLSELKINNRMNKLKLSIRKKTSNKQLNSRYQELKNYLPALLVNKSHVISGKTYLLPLLNQELKNKFRFNDGVDRIMGRLARHCQLDVDPGLRNALRKTAAGKVAL